MSHIVRSGTAVVHHKLLFMDYGAGHISLLYLKSYIIPIFYTKEAFGKVQQILMHMWILQVGISFIHCLCSQS